MIFGERGVGKTSLANVLQGFLPMPHEKGERETISVTRINCDRADSFTTIWKKVFNGMNLISAEEAIGFLHNTNAKAVNADTFITSEENVPDQVRQALISISQIFLTTIIIIDEFDRLEEPVRKLFADLIKALSDYAIDITIILIGVGKSIEDLINEHQSVSRALVQIQMPRMKPSEIEEIITNGCKRLGMTIKQETLEKIKILSKGLPYYAHLISLHALRDTLDRDSLNITEFNLNTAIAQAIEDSQHSIKVNYHDAVRSQKKRKSFCRRASCLRFIRGERNG